MNTHKIESKSYNQLKANLFSLNLPKETVDYIISLEDEFDVKVASLERLSESLQTLVSLFYCRTSETIELEKLHSLLSPYIDNLDTLSSEMSEILG